MPDLDPPPEHDPGPARRQAIGAAIQSGASGRRRTPILAAAAVAAIVAAGIAIPHLRSGDDDGGPAGGPDPSTPAVAEPGTDTTPRTVSSAATPRPPGHATSKAPKDPVEICRDTVAENGSNAGAPAPARDAKVMVRLDGRWGVTLLLSDGKFWVGCDTARYPESGQGSILEPSKLLAPASSDGGAFAVSNVAVGHPAIYDHYWAAGMLPRGVVKIRYTFPDGITKEAVVKDRFWVVEHLESKPIPPGQNQTERDRIKVTLARADGSVVRTHRLKWGEQTCAHVNHGC